MNARERILNAYETCQSVTGIHKITGYTWQKVAKILSTEGIIVNDNQAMFLNLYSKGMTAEEISKATGYAEKTVSAYLPRTRPVYNEKLSANALRIKECRERKQKQIENNKLK